MFPELNSLLSLGPDSDVSNKSLLVTESGTDATFILHHFISSYVKQGWNVCLVNLSQTFSHYNIVGNKLGVNLSKAKEDGNLLMLDVMKLVGEQIMSSALGNPVTCNSETPVRLDLESADIHCLNPLYKLILEFYNCLRASHQNPTLLILDDLSFLASIGIPAAAIKNFMHYLLLLSHEVNTGLLSFVHCNKEDEEMKILVKQLQHSFDISLQTYGLESGYCKDVHGELIVEKDAMMEKNMLKKMHFKITDKNVTFFPLGMSLAVL